MIPGFLTEELSSRPFRFPASLEQVYSGLIDELQREVAGFGRCTYCLEDTSRESVAWQFDRYLPAHYFKSYYSLLEMESDALQSQSDCHLLSWPSLTLIDVGCGSGAASLAALAILHRYQRYRITHCAPLMPVDVLLIGLDPNPHMLELYSRMVESYAEELRPELIRVTSVPYRGKFPEDIGQVLRLYQPNNRHSVLVILSNVIRILEDLYSADETNALEKVLRLLIGKKPPSGNFGAAEGIAIESILEEWGVDCVSILGVATTSSSLGSNQWRDGLNNLFTGIRQAISPHTMPGDVRARKATIRYHNPDNCFWHRKGYTKPYPNTFFYSHTCAVSQNYQNGQQWQEIISPANLELAWARARRYALVDEVLPDECEIRLFDRCLQDKLLRLRSRLLMQEWDALNVEHALLFHAPKKQGQTRPKATTRLEEQILSAAVVQKLGVTISWQQTSSFSHRLHARPGEYLYEHWFYQYRLFLGETRRLAAMSKRVLRADVTSFYQNVDQDILLGIIARELNTERTTQEALESIVRRDFSSDHQKGKGLPQGQIASGFWANLYLKQVDEAFKELDGVEFARYADDMVFAIDPQNVSIDSVERKLLGLLKVLHLETSEEKTFPQSSDEYREQTKLDQEIDKLAREVARLRSKLFRLNQDYLRRYSSDRWRFLNTYRELLGTLDISISPNWLGRKIEQEESKIIWFISGSLKFPQYPTSIEEIDQWGDLFRDQNVDWMLQLDAARKRLVDFFSTALGVLADEQKDEYLRELHRRRLRFATNRLCGLGLTPIADQVATEVIGCPWLIEVRWVCPGLSGCGRYDLLLKILRESELAFVRAHALRALAHHASVPEVIGTLWSVLLNNEAAPCEKLKASESLLAANNWDGADFDTCVSLVEAEGDPYLQKNYVLILGHAFKEKSRLYLESLGTRNLHSIVIAATQYLLSSNFGALFSNQEPDVLLKYYDKYYPDDESDDKSDESDPSWIPF